MKKILLFTILCTVTLYGCSNEQPEKAQPTKEVASESIETNQNSKTNEEQTEKTDLNTEKEGVRAEIVLKDNKKESYLLQIVPTKEESYEVTETWAGASVGDTVYFGDYELVLSDEEGKALQKLPLKNIEINGNRGNIQLLNTSTEVLAISQFESTNVNSVQLFTVRDGKLIQMKDERNQVSSFLFTGDIMKEVQPLHFQFGLYDNMEGKWTFTMFKLNPKSDVLEQTSVEQYGIEEGNEYIDTNFYNN